MPTNDLEDLITQAEAARLRGVTREAIYGLVARRKLETVEIGGQKFVRRSEVENYIPESGGRPAAKTRASESAQATKRGGKKSAKK